MTGSVAVQPPVVTWVESFTGVTTRGGNNPGMITVLLATLRVTPKVIGSHLRYEREPMTTTRELWLPFRQRASAQITGGKMKGKSIVIGVLLAGLLASCGEKDGSASSAGPVKNAALENSPGAVLNGQNLTGQDFYRANLTGASLRQTNAANANFSGASLDGASLDGANFSGAQLTAATFRNASIKFGNFATASLAAANFTGADLTSANFNGANLGGANFTDANLMGANLEGTTIRVATVFTRANVSGATLPAWFTAGGLQSPCRTFGARNCP